MINFYHFYNGVLDKDDNKEYIAKAKACKMLFKVFGVPLYEIEVFKWFDKYRLDS